MTITMERFIENIPALNLTFQRVKLREIEILVITCDSNEQMFGHDIWLITLKNFLSFVPIDDIVYSKIKLF